MLANNNTLLDHRSCKIKYVAQAVHVADVDQLRTDYSLQTFRGVLSTVVTAGLKLWPLPAKR